MKKTWRQLKKRLLQVVVFRWEFLRRNQEYVRDFQEYHAFELDYSSRHGITSGNIMVRPVPDDYDTGIIESSQGCALHIMAGLVPDDCDELLRRAVELAMKWQLPWPIDPCLSFDRIMEHHIEQLVNAGCVVPNRTGSRPDPWSEKWFDDLLDNSLVLAYMLRLGAPGPAKSDTVNYKTLPPDTSDVELLVDDEFLSELDITGVRFTREDAQQTIWVPINPAFPEWRMRCGLALLVHHLKIARQNMGLEQKHRSQFDKYTEYLQIYDLRKQGKTFKEIASIVFPEANPKNDETMKRVRRGYEACLALINRGFRQID